MVGLWVSSCMSSSACSAKLRPRLRPSSAESILAAQSISRGATRKAPYLQRRGAYIFSGESPRGESSGDAIPTVVPFSPGERERAPAAFVGVVESATATKQWVSCSTSCMHRQHSAHPPRGFPPGSMEIQCLALLNAPRREQRNRRPQGQITGGSGRWRV